MDRLELCPQFKRTGDCQWGMHCRFSHDYPYPVSEEVSFSCGPSSSFQLPSHSSMDLWPQSPPNFYPQQIPHDLTSSSVSRNRQSRAKIDAGEISKVICRYWVKGDCKFKESCKFRHDTTPFIPEQGPMPDVRFHSPDHNRVYDPSLDFQPYPTQERRYSHSSSLDNSHKWLQSREVLNGNGRDRYLTNKPPGNTYFNSQEGRLGPEEVLWPSRASTAHYEKWHESQAEEKYDLRLRAGRKQRTHNINPPQVGYGRREDLSPSLENNLGRERKGGVKSPWLQPWEREERGRWEKKGTGDKDLDWEGAGRKDSNPKQFSGERNATERHQIVSYTDSMGGREDEAVKSMPTSSKKRKKEKKSHNVDDLAPNQVAHKKRETTKVADKPHAAEMKKEVEEVEEAAAMADGHAEVAAAAILCSADSKGKEEGSSWNVDLSFMWEKFKAEMNSQMSSSFGLLDALKIKATGEEIKQREEDIMKRTKEFEDKCKLVENEEELFKKQEGEIAAREKELNIPPGTTVQ